MSKVIGIYSLRNGIGRTSITCLIGLKLAQQGYKVLLIDNNHKFCDLSNYLAVNAPHTIDDIIAFLKAGTLDNETLDSVIVEAEKNLDVLAGSKISYINNTLKNEELKQLKLMLDAKYDFIITDNVAGIDSHDFKDIENTIEFPIIVTQANKFDSVHFENVKTGLSQDQKESLSNILEKSIVIYNKAKKDEEYKSNIVDESKIYRINNSSKLFDYCSGFKCDIFSENENEIHNIVFAITNKDQLITKKKPTLVNKLRSVFKSS